MKRIRRVGVLRILLVVGAWIAFTNPILAEEKQAAPVGGMGLDEAIEIVLQRSPESRIADAGLLAAEQGRKAARGEFLAKLKTEFDYTYNDEIPTLEVDDPFGGPPQQIPVGTQNSITSSTTMSQPLFTGFALSSQYRIAELGEQEADEGRSDTRQELILKTYEAYFGVLLAEKYVEVADQAVSQLESHAEVARQFFENGMIPKNDMLKSLVTLAEAKQSRIEAEHDLQLAWARLDTLLRRDKKQERRKLTEPLVRRPYSGSMEECIRTGIQDHPSVRVAGIAVERAEKALTLARSRYYPNLFVVGALLHEEGGFVDTGAQLSATVHGEWNLWEWGSNYFKVQRSKAELDGVCAEKTRRIDLVKLQVEAAFLELKETDQAVDVAQAVIEQAEENYRITVEQYDENITTSTEVLDAQVLQARSRMNYFGALTRYNIATARLKRAMGTLGEATGVQEVH